MGKSDVGSPKWIAKQSKLKGLQRLKWYCQACQKQCRDEHGWRLHIQSPSHLAKVEIAQQNQQKYSEEFEKAFLYHLRSTHGRAVTANKVYNELIKDRDHVHMNSTRFKSLTAFIKYLESKGVLQIISADPEMIIEYIDRDAQAREERQQKLAEQKAQEHDFAQQKVLQKALEAAEGEKKENGTPPSPEPQSQQKFAGKPQRAKIGFSMKAR